MTAQLTGAPIDVEHVVVRLRRHGRRLVLPVVLLIALAAASGYFIGALPEAWMNWAAACGAAAIAVALTLSVLGWLATRATITNRRVIVRRGLFVQRRIEIPLSRVREVRTHRGPFQRMVGSGDIELVSGADQSAVLRDVPGPNAAVDALQELIERNFHHATSRVAFRQVSPFDTGRAERQGAERQGAEGHGVEGLGFDGPGFGGPGFGGPGFDDDTRDLQRRGF